MTASRTSASIDPIRYAASYQLAADEIRRAIELGVYVPGDRLPSTRELARQLGVSVATLREAVRGLIDQGTLEMRKGPKGGLVVLPGAVEGAGSGRSKKALLEEIEATLEFRYAVEPYAARLAAQRRTDADLKAIEDAYEAMLRELSADARDPMIGARFNRADSAFHSAIASASGNSLLVDAVEEARAQMFRASVVGLLGRISERADAEHDVIVQEIRRGRPDAAAKAMLQHLEATGADIREMREADFLKRR